MKRIIEIEKKDYDQICEVVNETESTLGITPFAGSIIAQSKPYEERPQGNKDCLDCVLDKIIAKIEALNPVDYVSMSSYEGHKGARDMKYDVLQIIDKYKEEMKGGAE